MKHYRHALATLVCAGATATPAHAGTFHCTFDSAPGSIAPGITLMGGSGQYGFGTVNEVRTWCQTDAREPRVSKIVSWGYFNNILCGTGTASSQASTSHVYIGALDIAFEYTATFSGFAGRVDITKVNGRPDKLPANGWIQWFPVPVGSELCDNPNGIRSFLASGSLTAAW